MTNYNSIISEASRLSCCLANTNNTSNTTRFQGKDQYQENMAVSEAVWNNANAPMKRPGVVILARGDGQNYQDALISASLIHFPRNGPVLLTEPNGLTQATANEILRLNPTGMHSPAQIITVGSLSPIVDEQVRSLGYSVCRIAGGDPAETAVLIWNLIGKKQNIMLVSGEYFGEGLVTGGWAAHMGDPILLTCTNFLTPVSAQAIKRMQPNVYIVGGPRTISYHVEEAVRNLTHGFVDRISGEDPFEVAVNFTKYKSPKGDFGWNVNKKDGWSFRFARFDQWYGAINGNPLSHMGKHSPLLLVHSQALPGVVEEYILSVNPVHTQPKPPFMHGYLVGNAYDISCPVQIKLDSLLETVMEHQ